MSTNAQASIIDQILAERPNIHKGETEIARQFTTTESFLPASDVQGFIDGKAECYGIDQELAYFFRDSVHRSSKSLEIGAGLSTLVFAVQQSQHTCVTPSQNEVDAIRAYAARKGISMDRVTFVVKESDKYLPIADLQELNLVFIDGKHAFPWPFVDWFYTADRLLKDGIMIVDDADMISGRILTDFMKTDPRWELLKEFGQKTFAFRKLTSTVHDVAWHMQPFIVNDMLAKPSLGKRVIGKVKRMLK